MTNKFLPIRRICGIFLVTIFSFLATKAQTDSCNSISEQMVMSVLWYQKAAEMRACYYQAFNLAKMSLDKKLAEVKTKKKKAVVVDVDETVLNNVPFEAKCIETGKPFSQEDWKKWTDLSAAEPLPGAVEFLQYAQSKGVETFYITNRLTNETESTLKNLRKYNFPNVDSAHFLAKTTESSKTLRRSKVSENYEILLLVGDNLLDFSDIFTNRENNYGLENVDANKQLFGDIFIILPNPMYGDWERAIYGKEKLNSVEKARKRKTSVKSGY